MSSLPTCSRLSWARSGGTGTGGRPVASIVGCCRQQRSSAMNQKAAESTLWRLAVRRPWLRWMAAFAPSGATP
jgi:hypothetical protein